MAIFEAENMQKLAEVFQDEEYFRLVRPDEQKFIKMTSAKPVAGSVVTFIDNWEFANGIIPVLVCFLFA